MRIHNSRATDIFQLRFIFPINVLGNLIIKHKHAHTDEEHEK